MLDAAAATIPLAAVAMVVTRAVPSTPWWSLWGALAQVGLACLLAAWVAPYVRRTSVWGYSGGALIGGVICAIFAGSMVVRSYGLRQRAIDTARTLTEDRVVDIAAASLLQRWRTGEFPATDPQRSGSVRLSVTREGHERAVYAASSGDLPGVAVAKLQADGGLVCWRATTGSDDDGTCEPRARFLVGTVTDTHPGIVVFKDARGVLHRLSVQDAALSASVRGTAIAVVDAPSHNLMALYSVAGVKEAAAAPAVHP